MVVKWRLLLTASYLLFGAIDDGSRHHPIVKPPVIEIIHRLVGPLAPAQIAGRQAGELRAHAIVRAEREARRDPDRAVGVVVQIDGGGAAVPIRVPCRHE